MSNNLSNKEHYTKLYSTPINVENTAVLALGELGLVTIGHFFKKKQMYYTSYPLVGKNDIMLLLKATNTYAELTKRYLAKYKKNEINHVDFESLIQDSCRIFSRDMYIAQKDIGLSEITEELLEDGELSDLILNAFPDRDIFDRVDKQYKLLTKENE